MTHTSQTRNSTREEIKLQLKKLPSDKATGPDGITSCILQAGGECAIDMIYMYMLIVWEVQTYPCAWTLVSMQPIYKDRGKDRHCPSSYCGIYLLNTLTKLLEGLIESHLSQFTEKYDTLMSVQQGSRTSRQIMMPYSTHYHHTTEQAEWYSQLLLLRRLCYSIPLCPQKQISPHP